MIGQTISHTQTYEDFFGGRSMSTVAARRFFISRSCASVSSVEGGGVCTLTGGAVGKGVGVGGGATSAGGASSATTSSSTISSGSGVSSGRRTRSGGGATPGRVVLGPFGFGRGTDGTLATV